MRVCATGDGWVQCIYLMQVNLGASIGFRVPDHHPKLQVILHQSDQWNASTPCMHRLDSGPLEDPCKVSNTSVAQVAERQACIVGKLQVIIKQVSW